MKLSLTFVSVIALGTLGTPAHADKKDKAEAEFNKGKKLMGEQRYADACEAFEKSMKLDRAIGTQLNIAKCYEEWGKIGRAFLAFQTAEKMAKEASDDRAPKIHDLVVKLEPQVPHLTLKVPPGAPKDLVVTLDSHPVDTLNDAFIVDPGPHTIEWSTRGGAKKRSIVPIDRGADAEVTLEMPAKSTGNRGGEVTSSGTEENTTSSGGDGGSDKTPDVAKPSRPGRGMRIGGIVMMGAGAITMGVSGYMAFSAKGDYDDALKMYCNGVANMCDMTGLEITHDARSTANKATIVFGVGAALVAGGALLYLLAPSGHAAQEEQSALYVTPTVSPSSVGLVFGGQL